MRITPRSDKELASMNLMPQGQYSFEVIDAKDRVSKSGNEMIELKIKIWDSNGKERIIYDYLLDSMAHKVKHFCQGQSPCSLIDVYDMGELLAEHCLNKTGYLELIIQKDKTGIYGDKNAVKDYIVKDKNTAEVKKEDPFFDDDISF